MKIKNFISNAKHRYTVVSPLSHIFVRPKKAVNIWVCVTKWVLCDYLGTLEDFALKVSILVLEFDFCLLFRKIIF